MEYKYYQRVKNILILAMALLVFNTVFSCAGSSIQDTLAPQSAFQSKNNIGLDDTALNAEYMPSLENRLFLSDFAQLLIANGFTFLGEGGMGTVFEYAMPDGKQIVIKLPNFLEEPLMNSIAREKTELSLNQTQNIPNAQRPFSLHNLQEVFRKKAAAKDIDRKKAGQALELCKFLSVAEAFVVVSDKAKGSSLKDIISGKDNEKLLVNNPALRIPLARAVIETLSATLQTLHRNGRIFMDLKPDNIRVHYENGKFEITLLDFGISSSKTIIEKKLREGNQIGTPFYVAPEQWGRSPNDKTRGVDSESFDTYGLAMTLFSIMTGVVSFEEVHKGTTGSNSTKIPPMRLFKKSRDIEFLKFRLRNISYKNTAFRITNLGTYVKEALFVVAASLKILWLEYSLYKENIKYEQQKQRVQLEAVGNRDRFATFILPKKGKEGQFFAWFEALFPEEMKDRRYNGLKHTIYSAIHPDYRLRTTDVNEFSRHAVVTLEILWEKTQEAPGRRPEAVEAAA
jgi:serine/threonine protein kinase